MSLYIEIDGKPVPAKDAVWIERAPCGCISGASVRNWYATSDDDMDLTAEQFVRRFHSSKSVSDRAREDGFTQEPMTSAQWKLASEGFRADCPHDPRFGHVVVSAPDGMSWATTDKGYGRRTFKRHLVTAPVRDHAYPYPDALCGYKPKGYWSDYERDLHDTVTCRKCEAKVTA